MAAVAAASTQDLPPGRPQAKETPPDHSSTLPRRSAPRTLPQICLSTSAFPAKASLRTTVTGMGWATPLSCFQCLPHSLAAPTHGLPGSVSSGRGGSSRPLCALGRLGHRCTPAEPPPAAPAPAAATSAKHGAPQCRGGRLRSCLRRTSGARQSHGARGTGRGACRRLRPP